MEQFEMKHLKQAFKDICKPLARLDNGHYSFCRIYVAELPQQAGKALLKVYDLADESIQPMMQDGEVREISCYRKLISTVFPKLISSGTVGRGKRKMAYMLTKYLPNARTLTEYVRANPQDKDFRRISLCELAMALKELEISTHDGGHFNINPDNVLISEGEAYLVGMTLAGKAELGKMSFDTHALPIGYRSKETLRGYFSPKSDVYAFCLTAYFFLTGKYPFNIEDPMTATTPASRSAMQKAWKQGAHIEMEDERLKKLLLRGIDNDPQKRFMDMGEIFHALNEVFGFNIMTPEEAMQEAAEQKRKDADLQCHAHIGQRQGRGFADVAGMEGLKQTLTRDFVKVLQNIELARAYNITPPNIILYGPPGCGKTFIATKLAEESGLAYSYIKPSDLGSIYVHGTQGKIADLFEKAAQQAPCLLCIDEIDALLPQRGNSSNDKQNDEVAEWLTQLNECTEKGVYVVAMTNRISAIDEAVLRRGRFDAKFYVPMPDVAEREELFRLSLSKCPTETDIDLKELARQTDRYTSSDIVSIVKDAAREAFDRTVNAQSPTPLPIGQDLLLDVLQKSHPSVSARSLQNYEREHERYTSGRERKTSRIGFQY